jgi:hypothetical protein
MDVVDIFSARPASFYTVLSAQGLGFYIPAYQREYSWDKQNIARLFEDSSHGLSLLPDMRDALTFLGTLIVIPDTKYETVNPKVVGDLPSKVLLVIDGQQRLTTILLLNIALHNSIQHKMHKMDKKLDPDGGEESKEQWLVNQCRQVCALLQQTFEQDMNFCKGRDVFRYYPKIVRAYDDRWSRTETKAQYTSPIAAFVHQYSVHFRDAAKKVFRFASDTVPEGTERDKHIQLGKNFRTIVGKLKVVEGGGGSEEIEFPPLPSLAHAGAFQETLTDAQFPEIVKEYLANSGKDAEVEFDSLLRLTIFAQFMLKRVSVTEVEAKNEAYAFDIFEALNTTGTPLTSIETFKPRVIETETPSLYEDSASRPYMEKIDAYVGAQSMADQRHSAASRLVIPFSLAEVGEKLSKRLSDQRRFFKKFFESLTAVEERRGFVKRLAHVALFRTDLWPDDSSREPDVSAFDFADENAVRLCLDVLRKGNHEITIAPLVRFYSAARGAQSDDRKEAMLELERAAKAIAAFYALWRGSRHSTDRIDSHYRELMKTGFPEVKVGPMAATLAHSKQPSSADLKAAFRYILSVRGGISTRDQWIAQASQLPVYKVSNSVARFLLLAAFHNTVPANDGKGGGIGAKEGTLPMLTLENWRTGVLTVEHIAPETVPKSGWKDELYIMKDTIDCLGNLTLLPSAENASLGNRSWKDKRLFYSVLASPTQDESEKLRLEAENQGMVIAQTTKELLQRSVHMPYLKALADVQEEWGESIVASRSKCLAGLAYDRLAPWLDLQQPG